MIKLVTCGIVCFKLFLHHLLLYFCKLCSEACASALCLRTRLGELQFASQVGTFICCTRGLTTESIGPASGIICRSRSYVPAWRGATLNKQSTGLRRHCPGLSLVSMT